MFHSIYFDKMVNGTRIARNTWTDWHLIPSSRPDIQLPSRKMNFVDIPGKDGSLDMSNYLTGRPMFDDRSGTWEFIVVQEYDGKDVDTRSWIVRKNELTDFFDGSFIAVRLEDQPGYFYRGRVYIDANGWKTGPSFSTVTISYRLDPYKKDVNTGEESGL